MANVPANYALFNQQLTKNMSVVVKIEGVPDLFSNRPIYTKIRYGDPGISYGDPGLVYGALRKLSNVKDYLSLDGSSITISQMVEPERGKGSVSQLSLSFVDVNQYMSNLITPGAVIPDILGARVQIFLGYQEISYPEDFFQIFVGYVTKVNSRSGMVLLSLSDPSVKRRKEFCYIAKNNLTAPIDNVVTTIPFNTGDYAQRILGPLGTYDPAITLYIQINDEFIDYTTATVTPTALVGVTRGARGSTAKAATTDDTANAIIQIQDHAIDMALKMMQSGWNGYWKSSIPLSSIYYSLDGGVGNVPGAFVLSDNVDAIRDYGLTVGDFVTTTGASNGANNVTLAKIVRFQDVLGQTNRMIVTDAVGLVVENPTAALMSVRSQYDTYPVNCGLQMGSDDIDVARHLYTKRTFLPGPENSYRFFILEAKNGKDFIEEQIYLPVGAYAITRNGRLSIGLTKPPLADQQLITLTSDNLTNVQNIAPERSSNNRKFYNIITYDYDFDDTGSATSLLRVLDSNSLNVIGFSSTLPVISEGGRSDLDAAMLFNKRSSLVLSRFKNAAVYFDLEPLWTQANQIESGDVVAVSDDGSLQLSNFATGKRDLGTQLFEVVNRQLDIKTGRAKISVVNGVGAEATDRFATIGPSSVVGTGSGVSSIIITDSFGAVFPGNEQAKWTTYIGQTILVHNESWSYQEETTLISFDSVNRYKMNISPPLSGSPPAGYIVDVPDYPTSVDPTVNAIWKLIHCFWSPRVPVVSGTSSTVFDVSAPNASKFLVGAIIIVHDTAFTIVSPEVHVTDVTGTTITVDATLGFTPSAGQEIDLIGFADKGFSYRWI